MAAMPRGSTTGGAAITGKGRELLSATTIQSGPGWRNPSDPVAGGCGTGTRKFADPDQHPFRNQPVYGFGILERPQQCAGCEYLDEQPHAFYRPGTGADDQQHAEALEQPPPVLDRLRRPVKIPGVYERTNKTFFYTLWDQNIRNTRQTV